jgi:two-component system, chemotaxis family, protein-glutamate methylesterase/glutaminase
MQGTEKIRLLVVDDSALMRKHLVSIFSSTGEFEVVTARNGVEAVAQQRSFNPDVITLDVNMPEMDGLTALSMLMAQQPTPVVMVSSLTEKGAVTTFEALALGAVDFVPKPGGTISLSIDSVREQLIEKVRVASRSRRVKSAVTNTVREIRREIPSRTSSPVVSKGVPGGVPMRPFGVVCIGVSTGGPRALEEILPALPASFPWPVLISQHMPPTFTEAFANRLNGLCALEVVEVSKPMVLMPGLAYIGKGGTDMVLSNRAGALYAVPKPENPELLWHPSVEALMASVMGTLNPAQVVGVMLTGMGYDGSDSMAALKKAGARTIAESEESATIFGMPAELIRKEGASVVLPCNRIAHQLKLWVGTGEKKWA